MITNLLEKLVARRLVLPNVWFRPFLRDETGTERQFRASGLGFRLGLGLSGFRVRIQGLGFLGFWVEGSGFRVEGFGLRP